MCCCFLALIYLYKCVPEPPIKKQTENSEHATNWQLLKYIFVDSVLQNAKTLFKTRPGSIRCILFLQLIRFVYLYSAEIQILQDFTTFPEGFFPPQ